MNTLGWCKFIFSDTCIWQYPCWFHSFLLVCAIPSRTTSPLPVLVVVLQNHALSTSSSTSETAFTSIWLKKPNLERKQQDLSTLFLAVCDSGSFSGAPLRSHLPWYCQLYGNYCFSLFRRMVADLIQWCLKIYATCQDPS